MAVHTLHDRCIVYVLPPRFKFSPLMKYSHFSPVWTDHVELKMAIGKVHALVQPTLLVSCDSVLFWQGNKDFSERGPINKGAKKQQKWALFKSTSKYSV